MADERSFESLAEAARFMEEEIDRPTPDRATDLGNGLELRAFPHEFPDGGFTNVYDLNWTSGSTRATVNISPRPTKPGEFARGTPATASGSFFALADRASGVPTQASLNLVISERRVLSLPVSDREALICDDGSLSTETTPASGRLIVNGSELTWTGSLTGRTADSYVYGNGNIVVRSERDPVTGTSRVLDEASRRTPDMPSGSGMVDVGFMAMDNGGFRSTGIASNGGVDIFRHDLVVRCPANRIDPHRENRMQIAQVGRFTSGSLPEFAVTAGPSLDYGDFASHPINTDASLGDSPPFLEQRKARMLFYQEPEGKNHLLLFDGRPGSRTFQGATPSEVQEIVASSSGYRWGCFLDSGQTAKLWVTERDGSQRSFGNRHYLGWPREEGGRFTWTPDQGRPMPSFITFHPRRNSLLTPATGLRDMLKKPRLRTPSGTARRPDSPASQKSAASPRLPPPGQPRRGSGRGAGA